MIEIKNMYKIYNHFKPNQFVALKDISVMIHANEFIVLKGVSGSGKSTLLSIIGAMSKPTKGVVCVEGKMIAKLPDYHLSQFRSCSIGFVFQAYHLIENLTVYDNVTMPLIPLQKNNIEQMVYDALDIANISHKKDEKVKNLSGGEKQRVAIARALVNNPNIILFDEPTASLDKSNSQNLISILTHLKSLGKTILIATHDTLFDNLEIVDRYIDIDNGEIR